MSATNARGEYAVTGLPEGHLGIVVTSPGQQPVVQRRLLRSGDSLPRGFDPARPTYRGVRWSVRSPAVGRTHPQASSRAMSAAVVRSSFTHSGNRSLLNRTLGIANATDATVRLSPSWMPTATAVRPASVR
ncbi:hypothetical protein SUDANB56_06523 (plasmid) [Streptomyces sp. enrichment culture]